MLAEGLQHRPQQLPGACAGCQAQRAFQRFARGSRVMQAELQLANGGQQRGIIGMRFQPALGLLQARGQGVGFAQLGPCIEQLRIPLPRQGGLDFVHGRQSGAELRGAARVGGHHAGWAPLRARQVGPQRVDGTGAMGLGNGLRQYACFQFGVGIGAQRGAGAQWLQRAARAVGAAGGQCGFGQFHPAGWRQLLAFGGGDQQRQGFLGAAYAAQYARAQHARGTWCLLAGFVQGFQCARGLAATIGGLGFGQQRRCA